MEQAQNQKIIVVSLLTLAVIAVAGALAYTKAILIPFLLSVLIVFLLSPLVELLKTRLKLPHSLTVLLSLILSGVAVTLLVLIMVSSVRGFIEGAEAYSARLEMFAQRAVALAGRFGYELRGEGMAGLVKQFPLMGYAQGFASRLLSLVSNSFLIFIFAVFLLLGQERSIDERAEGKKGNPLVEKATRQVRKYLAAKIATSAATGILVWLILAALGLDLAFMFGMLAFLLNFIPTVGSVIATLLPLPIALLQFDSTAMVVLAIALPAAVQVVIGNGIEPRLMGQSLGLHPVTILIVLMFWGLIWGGVGMILAVPITAVLKIFFDELETTKPISRLMEGRLS